MQSLNKSLRSPNRCHDRQFFYKYITAKVAKTILVTRKLRWSSPLLFNDPFDVTQELRLNFDEPTFNNVLIDKIASIIEKGNVSSSMKLLPADMVAFVQNSNANKRGAMANDLRQKFTTSKLGKLPSFADIKKNWFETVPTFRILCLSELNYVTSMWFHYSDKYEGVVLEFEAVDELDSSFLVARPVMYQDTSPAFAELEDWVHYMIGQQESNIQRLLTENLYVKTTAWSYEKEWRIASVARPGETGLFSDYGFHPRELTSIYFGHKCPEREKAEMLSLLVHGLDHVRAYSAIADTRQGRFTFTPASQNKTV